MASQITDPGVEAKAQQLASATGESVAQAIGIAVDERLARMKCSVRFAESESVESILTFVESLGLRRNDALTDDQILGYGPQGYSE